MSAIAVWVRLIWRANRGLDRPLFLCRALFWQVRRRLAGTFVGQLRNGARIAVQPSSAFSGMFYSRWVEEDETLFLRRHAKLAPTFVDVGANVGLFSAQLFDVFANFHLFEPAPSSFAALQATLALNPGIKATAYNVAVSDAPGELAFVDEGDCSTSSRVSAAPGAGTITVRADTLDNLLAPETGPFVLKVDVEGLETRVFAGAAGHFRARRPKLVMFERLERTNLTTIKQFFGEMDYTLFALRENGEITRDEQAIARPLINLFACPSADFDRLTQSRPAR